MCWTPLGICRSRGVTWLDGAPRPLDVGGKGILFASKLAPSGLNLAIFSDMLKAMDVLEVYDPAGALPKNQESWR